MVQARPQAAVQRQRQGRARSRTFPARRGDISQLYAGQRAAQRGKFGPQQPQSLINSVKSLINLVKSLINLQKWLAKKN